MFRKPLTWSPICASPPLLIDPSEREKRDEVLVVMGFALEFDERWVRVIEPTIRDDLDVKPNRLDDIRDVMKSPAAVRSTAAGFEDRPAGYPPGPSPRRRLRSRTASSATAPASFTTAKRVSISELP